MATKLVIVESPAKAKTIGSYLGSDYEVLASIGHIRDLVTNAKGLPEELRKKWWADYGVDVDQNFEPFYEVPSEKAAQVRKLRDAMKGKTTLVLATDEDREGEAISWHLLQVLKPAKAVKVERIAFHEITKAAILRAMETPRTVDTALVEAQETRRILDRLYGYTLSPVLWSRVTKNLSAGRVQSPAVKIIVERELARRAFVSSVYWDLGATFEKDGIQFPSTLRYVDQKKVATGSDFDDTTGALKDTKREILLIDELSAGALAAAAREAKPYKVTRVEATEGTEKPAPPFMTTTLQQDANRKFGYSADRTMRIAQTLYEGVDIAGEQIGLITYMRTDSLALSNDAIAGVRSFIGKNFADCLPEKPNQYTSKVRNAQEAHEAIRPTDAFRRPQDVARYLNDDQLRLYTLIWQRTVACQMKPARVLRTEADIAVFADDKHLIFGSSGRQILFEGFLRVYSEGKEDDAQDSSERKLPKLAEGNEVELVQLGDKRHETKPPARYTDATLIKRLEDQGIGRPSTYASIISVIVDRGYVRKDKRQLIPTFKAFLTMEVLEQNFSELMDLGFTAKMDEELDVISEGKANSKDYLRDFFLGSVEKPGLKTMVDERKKDIPYPVFVVGNHPETGERIIVRHGKDDSAFIQVGEGDQKRYANVPDDLPPADLTVAKALELLEQRTAPAESVGIEPKTGRNLLLKFRQGYYLEVQRTAEEIEQKVKPTWISVPPGVDPRQLSQEDLDFLCKLPYEVGVNPENNLEIVFKIGKFGAYIECGEERRTVADWRDATRMTVEQAVELLAMPKFAAARRVASGPLKELGELPGCAGPVKVLPGRFGPYVTDGEVNATLPKGTDPASVTAEQASALLQAKREAGPSVKRPVKNTKAKKPVAKAASAKATAPKPAAAKKPVAKKAPAKKPATKPKKS